MSEEGVLEEAEFFNVTGLVKILKEKIQTRQELTKEAEDGNKHVYRVSFRTITSTVSFICKKVGML